MEIELSEKKKRASLKPEKSKWQEDIKKTDESFELPSPKKVSSWHGNKKVEHEIG